jgi:hypothetical protein
MKVFLRFITILIVTIAFKSQAQEFGTALNFDGSNDYVSIPGGGGLNNQQTGTIEMWVRWSGAQIADGQGGFGPIMARQSDGFFSNQILSLDNANPTIAHIRWKPYSAAGTVITTTKTVGDGTWIHVAVTYSSGSHKLYINGALEGTSTASGTMANNASIPLTFGAWIISGVPKVFKGDMDEVRIWSVIRSASEIMARMKETLVGNEANLLAYYKFDTKDLTAAAIPNGDNRVGQVVGSYYNQSQAFVEPANLTNNTTTLNYTWPGVPFPGINADNFTTRWTGDVVPQFSETYTFYANTKDGVRLWVNDQLLIDKWVAQGPAEWTGKLALTAGLRYSIKMEYFNATGTAVASLSWSSPASKPVTLHKGSLVNGTGGAKLNQPRSLFVAGNYSYVVSEGSDALEIIDITNPASPLHVGSISNGAGGALLNDPVAVYVVGNYAYITSKGSNALEIVNVSNPASPVHAGSLANGGAALLSQPTSVHVVGNYAYVASSGSNALEIVDVTNKATPIHKGSIIHGAGGALLSNPLSVFLSGIYAYVTSSGSESLEIIDISNPAAPVHKGNITNNTSGGANLTQPMSIFVQGNYAYLANTAPDTRESYNSLGIIDVTNPAAPAHRGIVIDGLPDALLFRPSSVFVSGSYAYLASTGSNALEIIDITYPSAPVHKASIQHGMNGALLISPTSVVVSGNYAYVTSQGSNALEIVDVSPSTCCGSLPKQVVPFVIPTLKDETPNARHGSYNLFAGVGSTSNFGNSVPPSSYPLDFPVARTDFGNALNFDGVNDFIIVPPDTISSITGGFTLEA